MTNPADYWPMLRVGWCFRLITAWPRNINSRPGSMIAWRHFAGCGTTRPKLAPMESVLPLVGILPVATFPPLSASKQFCRVNPVRYSRLNSRSHELFADGFFLTRERIDWYLELYLDDVKKHEADLRFSPIHNEDLSGQPPALVITAGFDPLRDEGRAYHDRLVAAGVKSDYLQYDGMIHAFINMAGVLPQGKDVLEKSGAALKAAWV